MKVPFAMSALLLFIVIAQIIFVSSTDLDEELFNELAGDDKVRSVRSAAATSFMNRDSDYNDGNLPLTRNRRENWFTHRLRKAGRFITSPFRKAYKFFKRNKYDKYKQFYKYNKYKNLHKYGKYNKYKNYYKYNKYRY